MKKTILQLLTLCAFISSISSCGDKGKTTEENKDTVAAAPIEPAPKGTVSTNNSEYAPGDEIKISYTCEGTFDPKSAKIVIIPSDKPHEVIPANASSFIRTYYLGETKSGEITLVAPRDAGNYDVRMINRDSSGTEVSSTSFVVAGEGNTAIELSVEKNSYAVGEVMKVTYKAPVAWETHAWLGIIPNDIKHGDAAEADKHDVGWKYIEGRNGATVDMYAPTVAGKYNIRMFESNSGKEHKSVTFTVK